MTPKSAFCLKFLPLLALWLAVNPALAGPAPGKSQSLTRPDQVPDGLAKSDWASIRAAYEAGRHSFQPTATGWQARNPGQQWTTQFDRRGFLAAPQDGGWTWGLELQSYGFAGAERAIHGVPAVQADGQRLTYQWDGTVQEWFVNDPRGLEHGFTVKERPAGSSQQQALHTQPSTLNFLLAPRGTLTPAITEDAKGVLFRDAAGATVLNYTGLKVWDADGKVLPSRFELADAQPATLNSQSTVRLLVEERGARYPLTIDPIAQQAYLKAGNNGGPASDQFGWSVAVSGDTVVVGAYQEDSSTTGVNSTPNDLAADAGAAYVFVRSGTTWSQQAYLKASQVTEGDTFGYSVAVSGDMVVVGAYQEDSSTTGVNSTANDSTTTGTNSGAAYVFVRSGTTWSQQAYLKPAAVGSTQAGDAFGRSVAVSGDTVIVGAWNEDSSTTGVNSTANDGRTQSGAAYIFAGLGLPAEITVHGNGVPIPAGTSAPSLADHTDFGGAALTSGTVVRTFTLTNSGSIALTLSGTPLVAVSGTHAADFTVTALPTSPVTAGGSTTFQITFDPSASGTRTATLTIANNDSDEGTYTFALQGTGGNAPTVILPIADLVVNEDAPSVVMNLTLHFSDVETPATDLTYVLVTNTNSALVGATITQGTNLVLTFATNGNGTSQISVSAADADGLSVTNAFVVTVIPVSDAPVATYATYGRAPGLTLKIPIAAIVSDPNSLTVAVHSLGASAQGATLSFNSTYIFYVPANHNNDSFTYTVTNTAGESASATLSVTVATVGGSAKTITVVGGNATVRFFGIPGLTYDVQRTVSLSAPVTWTTLTTGSALAPGADGAFSHTDTNAPNGTAYYRSAPR